MAPNSAAVSRRDPETERAAVQLLHADDDDQEADEEPIEVDPTILEDMGYDEVRRALQRLECYLQRRT